MDPRLTVADNTPRRVHQRLLADRVTPLTISIVAREVVDGFVTVQFFNELGDGSNTAAGILSMTVEEWQSPAWRAMRHAAANVRDESQWGIRNSEPRG